jgi:hypothetical protein
VFKQAVCMMACSGEIEIYVLSLIKGAILFGVPSEGMDVSDIRDMLGTRPNQVLLDQLSRDSSYLSKLEVQFTGISQTRQMILFWAYETSQTPQLLVSGSCTQIGPDHIPQMRRF